MNPRIPPPSGPLRCLIFLLLPASSIVSLYARRKPPNRDGQRKSSRARGVLYYAIYIYNVYVCRSLKIPRTRRDSALSWLRLALYIAVSWFNSPAKRGDLHPVNILLPHQCVPIVYNSHAPRNSRLLTSSFFCNCAPYIYKWGLLMYSIYILIRRAVYKCFIIIFKNLFNFVFSHEQKQNPY